MQEMKFSHTEWKLQFRLSVFMLNSWFSFVSCQTVQQAVALLRGRQMVFSA